MLKKIVAKYGVQNVDVSAVEFLEPNMYTLSNFVYSTKNLVHSQSQILNNIVLSDSKTKQCKNFSVCAQWMIWQIHSIYQFIYEFYDICKYTKSINKQILYVDYNLYALILFIEGY